MKKYFTLLYIFIVVSFIVAGQNVGIGTTTPSEKLHVAGNIKGDTLKSNGLKITPNAGLGKLLISDATGNASWQATGNLGFGVWGDCATTGNITEFNPVVDPTGDVGDRFGANVSISGNFAIVSSNADDVNFFDQGSASIYRFNGTTWEFMQKLIDASGEVSDNFGASVSISGNYAIVGAAFDDGPTIDQGSASIYKYNGSSWEFMQKLIDGTGLANDLFGWSVSISGNYAIVGSYSDDVLANANQGSASIYQYNGSSWVLMQKLTDATGGPNDNFGNSVSISGNYALVGAYMDDVAFIDQGSATIYRYNGSNWVFMQQLSDVSGAATDWFGYEVSISGNYAIVGAIFDDINGILDQGSASIYQYNGISWVLMNTLIDATGAANDRFGSSVSISGDYAIVGSQQDDIGSYTDQGSASIFLRLGHGWGRLQYITDPLGNPIDYFGSATAIDGNTKRFLIGAYLYGNDHGKAVFGKIN